MITADQLLCHAIGDYVIQSDWMANEKTKRSIAALLHVLTYAIPFLFLRPSWLALFIIVSTHFVIDRWRLARYVCWVKNFLSPRDTMALVQTPNTSDFQSASGFINEYKIILWWKPWQECKATGYSSDRPAWLAVWLMIIADNIMHICINGLALKYL